MKKKVEQVVKLLSDLAAFNKLDLQIVSIISLSFDVDAEQLCEDNGITYFIPDEDDIGS
jgi:hypothetical protein